MSQQGSADHGPPALPFYELVERIRNRNGWTKVRLAREIGVNRGTVDNWARQSRAPLAATIVPVAEALGIDIDEALALAGIVPRGQVERVDPEIRGEDESAVDWMDRQYARWRDEKGPALREIFKSWDDTG